VSYSSETIIKSLEMLQEINGNREINIVQNLYDGNMPTGKHYFTLQNFTAKHVPPEAVVCAPRTQT
jgi:hypothetical protein